MTESPARSTALPRVGPRLLASLIAGRASYRVVLYTATVLLVQAWGRDEFASYATALGAVMWIVPVIQDGQEKAALKLIPRARRTHRDLVVAIRALVLWLPIPFDVVTLVLAVLAPSSEVTLLSAAAARYTTLSCTMLAVALHRVLGRPNRDTLTFLVLSAGTAALLIATFAVRLSPITYLCVQAALSLTVNMVLLRGLPHGGPPGPRRRTVRRLLAGTAVFMGLNEVLNGLALSVLFVELAATAHTTQNSDLYLVTQGWGLFVSGIYFLQRVFQPRLSMRLAAGGGGAVPGRRLAIRLARVVLALNVTWLALTGALLASGLLDTDSGPLVVVLGAMMIPLAPIYLLMSQSTYLVENVDAAGLRTTAFGSALGMVAVATAGLALIPTYGAVGALCALATRELPLSIAVIWHYRNFDKTAYKGVVRVSKNKHRVI